MTSPTTPSGAPDSPSALARGMSTAAWCLGFLLLLELVTRLVILPRATGPTPNETRDLGAALQQIERRAGEGGTPIQAAFLGASHTQAGVATRDVERTLGLPAGSLVNAGLSNARPRDMLRVYEANRDLFRQAKVVYVATGVSYLNRNGLNRRRTPAPAWRRRSTWEDRLAFPADLSTRIDLVVGWFWKTWDQRTTWKSELRRWLLALVSRGGRRADAKFYDDLGRPGMGPEKVKMTPELLADEIRDTVERHLFLYEIDDEGIRSLSRLFEEIREDGAVPVLIELPLPAGYQDTVRDSYPVVLARHSRAMRDHFGEVASLSLADQPIGLGLDDFRDADHLSIAGAKKIAPWIARDLAARGVGTLPEALRPPPPPPPPDFPRLLR